MRVQSRGVGLARGAALSTALAASLVLAAVCIADTRSEDGSAFSGNWTVNWYTKSYHTNEHYQDCFGRDDIMLEMVAWPANRPQIPVSGVGNAHARAYASGDLTTPLAGTIYCTPKGGFINVDGQSVPVYADFTDAFKEWEEGGIMGSIATLNVELHTNTPGGPVVSLVTNSKVVSGHQVIPRVVANVADIPGMTLPDDAPPITCTLYRGGIPSYELNQEGHYVAVYDENHDVIWDSPPELALRLQSSISHGSGYSITYNYQLENLTDEDWEFDFPDIRTSVHTTGWSGTICANDTISITNTVGGQGESVWKQTTQGTFTSSQDEELVRGRPMRVYIPQGRAAFTGIVAIQSAARNPTNNVTTVTFQSTASALEAYLYRWNGAVLALIDSIQSPMSASTNYTLEDADTPAGINEYYVVAGNRTNGAVSDTEEVEN